MSRWRPCWPACRRNGRAFTLTEVTVSASLFLLLLTSTYTVLISSLTNYAVESNASVLQQGALTGLARLDLELRESDSASVSIGASPPGIVFASPRDNIDRFLFYSGDMTWQSYVCYYVATSGAPALVRKAQLLASPAPVPPPVTLTTAYFSALASQAHVVGPNVTGISCTGSNPIRITLTTSHSAMGKADQVQITTNVRLRN